MGVYGTSTFFQGESVTPSAHPAPATSMCTTVTSISNGFALSSTASTTTTGSGSSTVSLSRFMSHFVRPRKRNAYSCGFAENVYRRERLSNRRLWQHQWCSRALGDALCVRASGYGGGGARWGGSRSVNVAHGGRAAIHTWIDFILDVSYGMDRTIRTSRSGVHVYVYLYYYSSL